MASSLPSSPFVANPASSSSSSCSSSSVANRSRSGSFLSTTRHGFLSLPSRMRMKNLVFASDENDVSPSSPDAKLISVETNAQKEDLAAKLAAAEAEAAALRKELASRSNKDVDLAKLKPATPEKRIDGTGFRETLFTEISKNSGKLDMRPNSWGLTEAELFLSKGAPTESSLGDRAADGDTDSIVRRRLLIGLGITVAAVALSFLKIPQGLLRPSKPLFFYLVPIVRLREQLKLIEESTSDANAVRNQLQRALNPNEISKDTFLSAAGWLEDPADADKAASLTYIILDYLNQADYNKYFESIGTPTAAQKLEFLKFSLQSVQTARENLDLFLALMPPETLAAANSNVKNVGWNDGSSKNF